MSSVSEGNLKNKIAVTPIAFTSVSHKESNERLLRITSLVVLVLQNTSLVLFMRYARVRSGDMFMSSTAVVAAEVIKLVFCLGVMLYEQGNIKALYDHLIENTVKKPLDCLSISVPAIIYVIQNNLLYYALSNLESSVFQVTFQLKILTTALFSVTMLQKKLTYVQWIALLVLTIGVAVVQLQTGGSPGAKTDSRIENAVLGFLAVVVASVLSGFAGVFFEKLLKHTAPSIFLRNFQLGLIGIVFGTIGAYYNDGLQISAKGFFFGYDEVVWIVVLLQSLGGIMVAVVIKYADNILKGFATSASILVTCCVSVVLFHTSLSLQFCVGASFVMLSIYLYGKFVHVPASK